MAALGSGSSILPASRNEIVDSLATMIMMHTTSAELQQVALMFIQKYPHASDKVPRGAPYV